MTTGPTSDFLARALRHPDLPGGGHRLPGREPRRSGGSSGPRASARRSSPPTSAARTPQGSAWIQFNIRFYVFALIFIVFDVEAVFLLPWAVVFRKLGLLAFVEGLVFIAHPGGGPRLRLAQGRPRVGARRGPGLGRMPRSHGPHPEQVRATNVVFTTVDNLVNWARKSSLWPMTFGLACCAIEMMATGGTPLRLEPLRHHPPRHAAPERPHDRGRHRDPEDGHAA